MQTWRDHRAAVRSVLKRQKRSVYWLCQQLAGEVAPPQIYGYLAGKRGLRPETMQKISDVLGLVYTEKV